MKGTPPAANPGPDQFQFVSPPPDLQLTFSQATARAEEQDFSPSLDGASMVAKMLQARYMLSKRGYMYLHKIYSYLGVLWTLILGPIIC